MSYDVTHQETFAGTNTLLMGEVGSGKTTALPSFIRAGLECDRKLQVLAILTEPNGEESLLEGMRVHAPPGLSSLPMDRLHYAIVPLMVEPFSVFMRTAERIGDMTYAKIAGDVPSIYGKQNTGDQPFMRLLHHLNDFTNQRGENLGPIEQLDSNWLVAIDSLSGVNKLIRQLHVGLKPSMHQGEWGTIMSLEDSFITRFVSATNCWTCCTAHIDKEMDEVLGKPQFMPALLGRKLAPVVPRLFSDVILAYRTGTNFRWSTTRADYSSLKARNLPYSDNLEPKFGLIVQKWLERIELARGN